MGQAESHLHLSDVQGGDPGGGRLGRRLDRQYRVRKLDFFSQAMVLHALLPGMFERGYGRIVCISSISAVLGQEAGSAYAAILGNPHPSRTPGRQDYLNRLSHMERVSRLEEFGKAIAFLLSDDASYISGAAVPIEGGLLTPRLNE